MGHMRGVSKRREVGQKGSDLWLQQHWAHRDALDSAEPGCKDDRPFPQDDWNICFVFLAFAEVLMKCSEAQQQ